MLKLSQIWSASAPSGWLSCSLTYSYQSLNTFFTSWHKHENVPSLSCTSPPRAPESSISSKSSAFLFCFVLLLLWLLLLYYFVENGISKNERQVCSMLLQGHCSQAFSIKRARQHISTSMYVYTHVYAQKHYGRRKITDMSNPALRTTGSLPASPLSTFELLFLGEKPGPRPP